MKLGMLMFLALGMLLFFSCRNDDDEIIPSVITKVTPSDSVPGPVKGFFLLNEGNMGSNKATLDYFDYASGEYHKNIFAERNPSVVKELGDVGNDIQIYGNKLYVANSGGYRVPNYDNTVSVIDLETFKETKKITVAINLHRMRVDQNGLIYVTSRGDYYNVHSNTYVINAKNDLVEGSLNFPASELYLCGDSLYSYSTEYSKITSKWTVNYTIYDTKAKRIVSRNFIKDGTEKSIVTPYALAVNPETGEIFVGDAGDYVTPGRLYCFGPDGKKKWDVQTGDIPAHIVFTTRPLQEKDGEEG